MGRSLANLLNCACRAYRVQQRLSNWEREIIEINGGNMGQRCLMMLASLLVNLSAEICMFELLGKLPAQLQSTLSSAASVSLRCLMSSFCEDTWTWLTKHVMSWDVTWVFGNSVVNGSTSCWHRMLASIYSSFLAAGSGCRAWAEILVDVLEESPADQCECLARDFVNEVLGETKCWRSFESWHSEIFWTS